MERGSGHAKCPETSRPVLVAGSDSRRNRAGFGVRVLAWRMQEKAFGGHDKATRRLLEAYGRGKPGDVRCARLKPGAALVREFGGVRHTVTIMPDGFVWQEKTYCGHSSRRLAPAAGGLRAWARAGPERLSVGLAASVGRRRGLNLLIGAPHAQSH